MTEQWVVHPGSVETARVLRALRDRFGKHSINMYVQAGPTGGLPPADRPAFPIGLTLAEAKGLLGM